MSSHVPPFSVIWRMCGVEGRDSNLRLPGAGILARAVLDPGECDTSWVGVVISCVAVRPEAPIAWSVMKVPAR